MASIAGAPPEIPQQEYKQRRDRAAQAARDRGLDGLVVWSKSGNNFDWYADVFYLTNHYSPFPQLPDNPPFWRARGHAALILPGEGEPILVVDEPDYRTDRVTLESVRFNRDVTAGTVQAIRDAGLEDARVGLVGRETMLQLHYAILKDALPEMTFVAADDILESMRIRKSDAEVEMLRHAASVGIEIMNATLEGSQPGRTEGDCVADGFSVGCKLGTQPWTIYMSSGPYSHHHMWQRMPTWDAEQRLNPGDIVHPDVFGAWRGYYYDLQRSCVVGRKVSSEAQRETLEAARSLIDHIINGAGPGMEVGTLFNRACEWLEGHGFPSPRSAETSQHLGAGGQNFPGFGHGLGLAFEPPFIVAGEPTKLERNMVLAVEADLGPEGNTAAHEEVFVVTDDGVDVITSACQPVWWE